MRIVAAGWDHIGQIDVKMLLTVGTVVRRVGHQEIHGPTRGDIAEVVYEALPRGVARGETVASWTGSVLVVTVVRHTCGHRKVFGMDNALRWV